MKLTTTKTRGSSKLFKTPATGGNTSAIVVYIEDGQTKTADFRGDGCRERATAKMDALRADGAQGVSYTA